MLELDMLQVNSVVDGSKLIELGYRLNIYQSAYVSKCGSTVVYLYRKPYFGEVVATKGCDEEKYIENLNELFRKGYLVERN